MANGFLVYKCRRCGEEFGNGQHCVGDAKTLLALIEKSREAFGSPIGTDMLTSTHTCSTSYEGHIRQGVGDLIGFDEAPTPKGQERNITSD